jgi:cell division ATPase FtsA
MCHQLEAGRRVSFHDKYFATFCQPRAEEVLMHVADEIKECRLGATAIEWCSAHGGGALLNGMTEIANKSFDRSSSSRISRT